MKIKHPIIQQTNKGEIKIIDHPIHGYLCIGQLHLGFDLVSKYAKKYDAKIPSVHQTKDLYERRTTPSFTPLKNKMY